MKFVQKIAAYALPLLVGASVCGCSLERIATHRVADTLAASGTTYASDDDPELIEAALPFSLKLMESVLAQDPDHRGLLAATSAAFTQYAYAFVQQDADALALSDSDAAWAGWNRARRLFLRARDYGLRGLETGHPGFRAALDSDRGTAVQSIGKPDTDLLYWTAVSWAAAISLGKDDPGLVADLGKVSALIDRALEVDEGWDHGSIHSFLVTFTMVRPDALGDRKADARRHFDRAVELTQGHSAGPYVAWAEGACIPDEDRACFDASIASALAVDPDADPERRLANTVMQRRAAWLKANVDRWILPPLDDSAGSEPPP
ncbi:MAG TPA: TRAP transporter TatT component family protein [Steroidobacteraceae bacterium]|jgi:predicted anti-sigma-YlaC factor YlaD|nr:TRAP transporter TatT component family protein [Steroidobacteraceae bacterium]